MRNISLLFVTIYCGVVLSKYTPISPCPRIYRYITKNDKPHGLITLPYHGESVLKLLVKASLHGAFEHPNFNLSMITKRIDLFSHPKKRKYVQYLLTFPDSTPIPHITYIEFNGRQKCKGNKIMDGTLLNAALTQHVNDLKRDKRGRITVGLLDDRKLPPNGDVYFYAEEYANYEIGPNEDDVEIYHEDKDI